MFKTLLKDRLRSMGLSVKRLGAGVSGVDLDHDVAAILGRIDTRWTFFDVGANVGDRTLRMRHIFPNARIIAFEPSPQTCDTLRARVRHDSQIDVLQSAVGAHEQEAAVFHLTEQYSVNDSLLAPVVHREKGVAYVSVTTLDAFCRARDITQIDWLKIDTQGSDVDVLRGADQLLRDKRIRLITAEAIVLPRYQGQHTLIDLLTTMQDYGYRLLGWYDPLYLPDGLSSFDMLFGLHAE